MPSTSKMFHHRVLDIIARLMSGTSKSKSPTRGLETSGSEMAKKIDRPWKSSISKMIQYLASYHPSYVTVGKRVED